MWILYLNNDGTVKSSSKISCLQGGLGNILANMDYFGTSLAFMGDHDGSGGSAYTLAVGAVGDDTGGLGRGAVHILRMQANGMLGGYQKISDFHGGFNGVLANFDQFGKSVAYLGDLDGDGVGDLAVGASQHDDGGTDRGAVWILFLNPNGTVKAEQKISGSAGGFDGQLDDEDKFGSSLSVTPDLNGDGLIDLVVGARGDDDGGPNRGALWLLFLNADGTVKAERKISSTQGGFAPGLDDGDGLGCAVASLGDFDGDGHADLLAPALLDDDGGSDRGAVYLLFADGTTQASASWRNPTIGGHTNPDVYAVTSPPVLGGAYTCSVTTFGPTSSAFVAGYRSPLALNINGGNLLVDITDPAGELLGTTFSPGNPAVFTVPVPTDVSLIDFEVATQAVRIDGTVLELTNAQDLVVGM